MSAVTNLDIRVPIGALFTALGLFIAGYGLVTQGNTAMYAHGSILPTVSVTVLADAGAQ